MAKTKVSDEVREARRAARMRPQELVLADIESRVPDLLDNIVPDGDWLWYCGPSLQGEENKATREALKDIGFLWAKQGHQIEATDDEGSWGHCCGHPTKFRRRGKDNTPEGSTSDDNEAEETSDPFAALARLAV